MNLKHVALVVIMMTQTCLAQQCAPAPGTDDPVAYVQAELQALQWIRQALIEGAKIPAPVPPDDPKRKERAAARNASARGLAKYYECASKHIAPYKESKNKYVRDSAEAFVNGIRTSTEVNRRVIEELEAIDKVATSDQVDPEATKRLVDLTTVEDKARAMITGAVKMSTFALVQLKPNDQQAEPVAFTITSTQRDALLHEIEEFRKQGTEAASFLGSCVTILLNTLNQKLPFPRPRPAAKSSSSGQD